MSTCQMWLQVMEGSLIQLRFLGIFTYLKRYSFNKLLQIVCLEEWRCKVCNHLWLGTSVMFIFILFRVLLTFFFLVKFYRFIYKRMVNYCIMAQNKYHMLQNLSSLYVHRSKYSLSGDRMHFWAIVFM